MKPDLFTRIAQEHLNIATLEERGRDALDFHEVSVAGIRQALAAAYAGAQDELLAAAQALLSAKKHHMETMEEWGRLRRAVGRAKRQKKALPKP